jgi:hypothetical protein
MIGNLLIFAGPDAINEYGHLLQTALHGGGVWIARLGLLAAVVIHIVATIQLTKANRAARADKYGHAQGDQVAQVLRTMIWSGLTILAFIVYHLLHFTVRVGNDYGTYKTTLHGETVHDVYRMVIAGFSWAPASIFYIIAMAAAVQPPEPRLQQPVPNARPQHGQDGAALQETRLCLRGPDLRRQLLHPHRHLVVRLRPLIFFLDFSAMSLDSTFPPARWP